MKYILILVISFLPVAFTGCSKEDKINQPKTTYYFGGTNDVGMGIMGNFLFTTAGERTINTFYISNPTHPDLLKTQNLSEDSKNYFWTPPSRFIFKGDTAFIAGPNGIKLYNAYNALNLYGYSQLDLNYFDHPVVSRGQYAYVTMHAFNEYRNYGVNSSSINELWTIDLKNISKPQVIKKLKLFYPFDLAIYENQLLVCDSGIKVYDISNPQEPSYVNSFQKANNPTEIHVSGKNILLRGEDGIYQYAYNNNQLTLLSKISFTP